MFGSKRELTPYPKCHQLPSLTSNLVDPSVLPTNQNVEHHEKKTEGKPRLYLLMKIEMKEKEINKEQILSEQKAYEEKNFKENFCPTCIKP